MVIYNREMIRHGGGEHRGVQTQFFRQDHIFELESLGERSVISATGVSYDDTEKIHMPSASTHFDEKTEESHLGRFPRGRVTVRAECREEPRQLQ